MQSFSQIVATNKPTPNFLQARSPSCHPANSVKALKGMIDNMWTRYYNCCILVPVFWDLIYNSGATYIIIQSLFHLHIDMREVLIVRCILLQKIILEVSPCSM